MLNWKDDKLEILFIVTVILLVLLTGATLWYTNLNLNKLNLKLT